MPSVTMLRIRLTNQIPKYSPVRPLNCGRWRSTRGAPKSAVCAGMLSCICDVPWCARLPSRWPDLSRTAPRPPCGASPERHAPAPAHHALHPAHQALHAAGTELAHHLFHLLELLEHLVDVGRRGAGTTRDARAARAVEQVRIAAFLRRHRTDDRDHARHFLAGDLLLEVLGHLADAGQLVHQATQAAHVLHLLELVAHVFQVEALALGDLLGELRRLLLVDLLLDLLDQRQHVAHVEDAAGDAVGMEDIQAIGFLARADELDRLARD